MKIKLPNGYLDEYDVIELPDLGAGPRAQSFLEGELICLMCENKFKVRAKIENRCAPVMEMAPPIVCPDCNSPIMYLGTDNASVMLTRTKKRKGKRICTRK